MQKVIPEGLDIEFSFAVGGRCGVRRGLHGEVLQTSPLSGRTRVSVIVALEQVLVCLDFHRNEVPGALNTTSASMPPDTQHWKTYNTIVFLCFLDLSGTFKV